MQGSPFGGAPFGAAYPRSHIAPPFRRDGGKALFELSGVIEPAPRGTDHPGNHEAAPLSLPYLDGAVSTSESSVHLQPVN